MRRKDVEIFIVKGASHRRCIQRFIKNLKPNHTVEVQCCQNTDTSILVTIMFILKKVHVTSKNISSFTNYFYPKPKSFGIFT